MKWRCLVCNHIHQGEQAPEVCPVCGKGREHFEAENSSPEHHHQGLAGIIERLHLHPVTSHLPNGALPLALLGWIVYLITGEASFERTSTYLALIGMVVAPITFFTGWSDAKHRFGTTKTGVFPEKIRLSWVLMVIAAVTVVWRFYIGWESAPMGGTETFVYTLLLIVSNALTARLGLLGGKLVFGH